HGCGRGCSVELQLPNTSIYSCSWGPPDDGKTMDRPSTLNTKAVVNGVQNGRGGKGSIFVFASGNGASSGDQCNFDGYTNSIFTVTVGAIDFTGKHPYYSEACAAMMVVTYSSGGGRHITSTNVGKRECSSHHGGTSAAAPLASAVFALALQVRPDLTWRDIQHLCVNAAVQVNRKDPDWEMTAAKRPYSYKYGYGKLDAALFVAAARKWKLVKPQAFIESHVMELGTANMGKDGKMTGGELIKAGGITHNFEVTTTMLTSGNFESLEHITIKVWITHPRRGDVQVELISPNGVKSVLAGIRKYDEDTNGFTGWEFSTLKHWDENPVGIWTIRVADQNQPERKGYFLGWQMSLWGATIDSAKYKPWVVPSPAKDDDEEEVVSATSSPTASSADANETKQHPKPTDHLPEDHGVAEGEAHKLAFPQQTTSGTIGASSSSPVVASVVPSPSGSKEDSMSSTSSPTPSSIVPQVVQDHQWVFSGLAAFAVIGFGTAIFIWRRRVMQRRAARAEYDRVAEDEDDIAMRSRGRESVVRDREDEFDEDNDELGAEGARLTGHGVGFHDGFLEDDDPASARSPNRPYRDDPPSYDHTPRRSLDRA
ncbi:peptidase S8/S53 domain-containing protein, partial [Auriculariales sp. MPI-PUGE-AT-0066]